MVHAWQLQAPHSGFGVCNSQMAGRLGSSLTGCEPTESGEFECEGRLTHPFVFALKVRSDESFGQAQHKSWFLDSRCSTSAFKRENAVVSELHPTTILLNDLMDALKREVGLGRNGLQGLPVFVA